MRVFADRLINVLREHREDIAHQWCKAVRQNPRTSSFNNLPLEGCKKRAVSFYANVIKMYFSEKPYTEIREYFSEYAEVSYKNNLPLHETIYGLIMMRRHMWLYADFQAPFLSAMDHQQAVETINKTIRIFDHGIYIVIQKYGELEKQ
ncbi:MAG: hypothetical protein U9N38_03160 [Thermodesulfobacteriota bacterium]|nr:hypothetical protein [Thermodesulfobacteriota bacterium]